MTVSVVIASFNSSRTIRRTLESVRWADEVVVVDGESPDGTADICRAAGAKVFSRPNSLEPNFNKNFGFLQASREWVLSLDSDEEVTAELRDEIRAALANFTRLSGFRMPRLNIFLGRPLRHGYWWPDCQLRLFRRGEGRFACQDPHEILRVSGKIGALSSHILHKWSETVSEHIKRLNHFARLRTERYVREKKQFCLLRTMAGPARQFIDCYMSSRPYRRASEASSSTRSCGNIFTPKRKKIRGDVESPLILNHPA
jgi:glycosyltransferase involved in cell wall biosynthesis